MAPDPITYLPATPASYHALSEQVHEMLRTDVLDVWFPRAVDSQHGGFYSDWTRDWMKAPSEGKFSVMQGRMTWIAAQAVLREPRTKAAYLPIVQHGVTFLRDVMWDKQYGGYYWGLADDGTISPRFGDRKQMYGISFCIYGLSGAYAATHDPETLEQAKRSFRWVEEHAHDDRNGGYFEWLTREGNPILVDPSAVRVEQAGGFPVGYKSMNTHIHLLESYTELYSVWKDETLRRRLQELLGIVRDKVTVQPGAMNLFFTSDWRPVPDHDSYGHDVEATYLLLEAAEALGETNDPTTERIARMLTDHALAYGWDDAHGGFFRDGTFDGRPEDKFKEWWVQMEGLNTLLLLHSKYGSNTSVYWQAFQKQLQFIRNYQEDPTYHGYYNLIDTDGKPLTTDKGSIWKGAYHDGRALMNVTERLNRMAAQTEGSH
ncbi:N-acylglucosamine 2-epimerase [Acidisarcina polymorpha]|uniref:N-acylglucosamine 2-epimerase n=1 Tax=Acidisarcina polymorpha TaxID=2211140 RepID=A0A2Z5G112_9BACT|nr:N-acylglucosamine 2-epimerase [Acidisarcina polymorpha]